jgi:hypothetical protein
MALSTSVPTTASRSMHRGAQRQPAGLSSPPQHRLYFLPEPQGTDRSARSSAVPRREPELRLDAGSAHTPTMTLKNAALLALIGTILMTALLLWTFVFTFLNVLRGVVPAVMLFQSFIYAFGSFSVALFFYVFHRAQ